MDKFKQTNSGRLKLHQLIHHLPHLLNPYLASLPLHFPNPFLTSLPLHLLNPYLVSLPLHLLTPLLVSFLLYLLNPLLLHPHQFLLHPNLSLHKMILAHQPNKKKNQDENVDINYLLDLTEKQRAKMLEILNIGPKKPKTIIGLPSKKYTTSSIYKATYCQFVFIYYINFKPPDGENDNISDLSNQAVQNK